MPAPVAPRRRRAAIELLTLSAALMLAAPTPALAFECKPSVYSVINFQAAMTRTQAAGTDLERSLDALNTQVAQLGSALPGLAQLEAAADVSNQRRQLVQELERLWNNSNIFTWEGTTQPGLVQVELRARGLLARLQTDHTRRLDAIRTVGARLGDLSRVAGPVKADLVRFKSEADRVQLDYMVPSYLHLESCFTQCSSRANKAEALTDLRQIRGEFELQIFDALKGPFDRDFGWLSNLTSESVAFQRRFEQGGVHYAQLGHDATTKVLQRAITFVSDAAANGRWYNVHTWANNTIGSAISTLNAAQGYPPTIEGAPGARDFNARYVSPSRHQLDALRGRADGLISTERRLHGLLTHVVAEYSDDYQPGCRAR